MGYLQCINSFVCFAELSSTKYMIYLASSRPLDLMWKFLAQGLSILLLLCMILKVIVLGAPTHITL